MQPRDPEINKALCYPNPTILVFHRYLVLIGKSDFNERTRTSITAIPLLPTRDNLDVFHKNFNSEEGMDDVDVSVGAIGMAKDEVLVFGAVKR